MSDPIASFVSNPVISFLLILVPLVVIHELGHFIMAKLGGIRVTNFSIGFGKKLFGFWYKGTEYRWNLLPLGGYVNFMGDLEYSNEIPDDVKHFYNRPKWIRFLVLIMGPLFNILLAFALFWGYRAVKPVYQAVFNDPLYTVGFVAEDSPEAEAGLAMGDHIIAIDGKPLGKNVNAVMADLFMSPNRDVEFTVVRNEQEMKIRFTIPEHDIEGHGVVSFGPSQRVMIGDVQEGMPAQAAGLQASDLVLSINGRPVRMYPEGSFGDMLQTAAQGQVLLMVADATGVKREIDFSNGSFNENNFGLTLEQTPEGVTIGAVAAASEAENLGLLPGETILAINGKTFEQADQFGALVNAYLAGEVSFHIVRDDAHLNVLLKPELVEERYLVGISFGPESIRRDLTWGQAFFQAGSDVVEYSTLIFEGVKRLVMGQLSVKTLSGPVGMARIANQQVKRGFWEFIFMMAIISLNLGILNLLPIPVLDGGEIFVLLVEWIGRRDFSLVTKMKIKMVGFVFIVGLMSIVIVNDVIKVFSSMG